MKAALQNPVVIMISSNASAVVIQHNPARNITGHPEALIMAADTVIPSQGIWVVPAHLKIEALAMVVVVALITAAAAVCAAPVDLAVAVAAVLSVEAVVVAVPSAVAADN